MEGIASEAASLAGHLQLGKLIFLYDDNHISIDGTTDLAFTEDVCKRFEAYGWHVQKVADGNDVDAIDAAHRGGQGRDRQARRIIAVRTHIGYGSPNKQDTSEAHGAPLGADEVKLTKEAWGWPLDPAFFVPDDVREAFLAAGERRPRRTPSGRRSSRRGARPTPPAPRRGTTPGRTRCPRAGTPTCPSSPPRTRSRPAPPPARSSTPWRRTCPSSWAARPTWRRRTRR